MECLLEKGMGLPLVEVSVFVIYTCCTCIIVECLLKARTVKPTETTVAKERLCKHVRC
jgi:hypothetical protein